jgi:hypothetical protein
METDIDILQIKLHITIVTPGTIKEQLKEQHTFPRKRTARSAPCDKGVHNTGTSCPRIEI